MDTRLAEGEFVERLILVVDDEAALVEILRAYLHDEGFAVIEAFDGLTAVEMVLRDRPDLVLLDLNLPRLSGLEAFRRIRAAGSNAPVIMLTSRGGEIDRIVGLELGADDYIGKPFSPREVVARVKAVLRRSSAARTISAGERDVTRVGPLEIDRIAHQVRRRGEAIELTPTEFRVLEALASHVNRVFTREQILDRISADDDVYDRTLDRHIANLRHKIEDEPARPKLVVTVVGVGYKLVEPPRVGGAP